MKTKEQREEELKKLKAEIRVLKEHRTERNRPTLWINKDKTMIEIHFENKTILADITSIDTETSREASDDMVKGSGFKQLLFKTQEVLENDQ